MEILKTTKIKKKVKQRPRYSEDVVGNYTKHQSITLTQNKCKKSTELKYCHWKNLLTESHCVAVNMQILFLNSLRVTCVVSETATLVHI